MGGWVAARVSAHLGAGPASSKMDAMSATPRPSDAAQNFSRPGALDLSNLAASAPAPASTGTPAAAGAYVVPVTETSFDAVVRMSVEHPVVLELTSPSATGADQLSRDLTELSDAAAGAWLLGRIDVDAEPRIAQALGVQAVPTVVAVIGGQLAPLFQGTKPKAEIAMYLDEVVRVAASSGVVGRAKPAAAPAGDTAAEPAVDPKYAAADQAMAEGRFDDAVVEFDKVLAQSPGDTEATTGRAQAALLARSLGFDAEKVVTQAAAKPDDIAAQLDAADLEVIQGDPTAAFNRILQLIRENTGDEREQLRLRLLELFETVGRTDPAVLKARRQLSSALF